MLLQAMVLIGTMVVLAGILVTSTLASAHAAFHEMILAKTQTATSDATARFASWAQDQVVRYGTEQNWPTTSQPTNADQTVGITTPVCDATQTTTVDASITTCPMLATMRWHVTGWSARSNGSQPAPTGGSTATNLSMTLHEQRISATITVVLTNATTHAIYATHSRRVTARIFDAYPYVAVTASRDASSEDLTATSLEGDTGGAPQQHSAVTDNSSTSQTPDRLHPTAVNGTTITTTIDCHNSPFNSNQARAGADTNVGSYIRVREEGNQAWLYETPCSPKYAPIINTAGAPPDYTAPNDNVYSNNAYTAGVWSKSSGQITFSH